MKRYKGLCHGRRVHLFNAKYAKLFAMQLEKLLVNDKTTALCQTNTVFIRLTALGAY